jgi:microcin C transport system substrate-binding protein
MKKHFTIFVLLLTVLSINAAAVYAQAPDVTVSYYFALRGAPKYKEGFKHFDYVNPDAPKGGTIVYSSIGTFDNFNRYAQRGVAAPYSGSLYDTLMIGSSDEIDVVYPLIAEKIEYPSDFTWVTFHINPAARFHDGKEITAEDVVFSFNKFFEEGVPQVKQYYKPVTNVEALSKYRAKFTLEASNKQMILDLATFNVLPKHFWEDKNFSEPLDEVPVGSSPYVYGDYKIGQYVILKRYENYWAKDLPVNVGINNFGTIRYDFYRDSNVEFEAFKSGEFDFFQESIAKNWATMYEGKQFKDGTIIKEAIEHEIPPGVQAIIFNIQNPLFTDIKVREAVALMFDYEWMNKYLFYGQYTRTRSFFQNTEYEAKGKPTEGELEILNKYRGQIPETVFGEAYTPPVTDGSGYNRDQIRKAIQLMDEAGWELKTQRWLISKLVNSLNLNF